jgi:hypothetical protein
MVKIYIIVSNELGRASMIRVVAYFNPFNPDTAEHSNTGRAVLLTVNSSEISFRI